MHAFARLIVACALIGCPASARAQADYQPARAPLVTAENAAWYLANDPILHAGQVYLPAGPTIHFNRNEMVMSGHFQGIPLYARTTIEPYSVVYVPLSGGLMKPYERRRAGDLAGTVGSRAPSFPVVRSWEVPAPAPQTPGPPPIVRAPVDGTDPGFVTAEQPRAVGTAGRGVALPARAVATGGTPRRDIALFVEFGGRRWFSAGAAAPLDRARMTRVGERHGLPVYADARDAGAIYIPVSRDAAEFVARYALPTPR